MNLAICAIYSGTCDLTYRWLSICEKQEDGLSRQSTHTSAESSPELAHEMHCRCNTEEKEVGDTRHRLTHVLLVSTLAPRGFESSLLVEECQNTHSQ